MLLKDYKPGHVISAPGFLMQLPYSEDVTWHVRELPASGYVTLGPCPITFTVPEGFNCVAAEISSIDAAIGEAAESYHQTMASLRQRKEALLQLSHSSDESEILDAPAADSPPQSFKDISDDIPF